LMLLLRKNATRNALPNERKNRQLHNSARPRLLRGRQCRNANPSQSIIHTGKASLRKRTDLMASPAVFNSGAAVPRMEMAYASKCRFLSLARTFGVRSAKPGTSRTGLICLKRFKSWAKMLSPDGHARTGRAGRETHGHQRRADARAISDAPIRHRDSP